MALTGAIGVLGGITGTAYYVSLRVSPPPRRTYLDSYTFTPWELGVPFETVEFRSSDGLRLAGWWLPRPETNAVIVGSHIMPAAKMNCLALAAIAGELATMCCCLIIVAAADRIRGRRRW